MRRTSGWAAAFAGLCLLIAAAVSSCATGGQSQAQSAYNACANSHNSNASVLETYWAFVAGVNSSTNQCFWTWGAITVAAAITRAMESCHGEYADCFVFSTSDGLEDWSREISDNGGSDGSGGGGSGWTVNDVVNLGVTGVGIYNTFSNNGGGGGSSGGGGGDAGGYSGGGSGGGNYNASTCAAAQANAQTCYNRWQGLGGGSTGQAGSEKDCYDLYTATAAQVCS